LTTFGQLDHLVCDAVIDMIEPAIDYPAGRVGPDPRHQPARVFPSAQATAGTGSAKAAPDRSL
jgi:hypothetical protein